MAARVVLALALTAAAVGGCGDGGRRATTQPKAPRAASILSGKLQPVRFADVRRDILRLYARHPQVRIFVYRDVYYTPETRDKVLAVCRAGGPATNARERETSRVFGCAPLIFFFYSFGVRKHVPKRSTPPGRSTHTPPGSAGRTTRGRRSPTSSGGGASGSASASCAAAVGATFAGIPP